MPVTVTFNGQPLSANLIYDQLEREFIDMAVKDTQEKIWSVLSPSEAAQITVDFHGSIDNLAFSLDGPDDLVARLRSRLGW